MRALHQPIDSQLQKLEKLSPQPESIVFTTTIPTQTWKTSISSPKNTEVSESLISETIQAKGFRKNSTTIQKILALRTELVRLHVQEMTNIRGVLLLD